MQWTSCYLGSHLRNASHEPIWHVIRKLHRTCSHPSPTPRETPHCCGPGDSDFDGCCQLFLCIRYSDITVCEQGSKWPLLYYTLTKGPTEAHLRPDSTGSLWITVHFALWFSLAVQNLSFSLLSSNLTTKSFCFLQETQQGLVHMNGLRYTILVFDRKECLSRLDGEREREEGREEGGKSYSWIVRYWPMLCPHCWGLGHGLGVYYS